MNLRPAAYWLLLVSCLLTWPGCARPMLKRQAAIESPNAPPRVDRPSKSEGQLSVARLTERSGQIEQAQRMYLALIEEQPSDPAPYHRLGVMAAQDKNWQVAEQYFNQAYAVAPPSTELLSDMGYLYYLQNRNQEAENILRQALAQDADDKAANNNLGLVLSEQQRFDDSLGVFRRAGSEAEARANLAFVLAQQGRYDQALEAYSQALSLDPQLRPAAMAMLQLAQNRQVPPTSQPENSMQTATNERPTPQRPGNDAVPAAAQGVAISDGPSPTPPAAPQAVTPVLDARADNIPPNRGEAIYDSEVVAANWQQERVAAKQPREPATLSDDDARPLRNPQSGQGPGLATDDVIRQEPTPAVPAIAFKTEPAGGVNKSPQPKMVVNEFVRQEQRPQPAVRNAATVPSSRSFNNGQRSRGPSPTFRRM